MSLSSTFVHADDRDVATIMLRAVDNEIGKPPRNVTGVLSRWIDTSLTLRVDPSQVLEHKDAISLSYDRSAGKLAIPRSLVLLSSGDRIMAQAVQVKNDSLTISWPALGAETPPAIPLEKVTAIILDLPLTMNERFRLFADLETFPPGADVVVLANGDRSVGEFESLDAAFIELKVQSKPLKIDRSRVRAIRMNPELTTKIKPGSRRTLISLADGSRISATSVDGDERRLKIKSPGAGDVFVPLSSVASAWFFGDHAVPVSDYEPAKVEFTPYLSATWPLMRNSNALHGPLALRGKEYATGLGMHSRMLVTYDLRGNEQSLQSLIGIDDAAKGAGSAVFAVELDGRRVWTSGNITGQTVPMAIPEVDLRGAKRLTLLVDFGQFADVSDYADWCDAVFILSPSQ